MSASTAQVAIPDTLPTAMLPGPGLLSMTAGDFVAVYGAPGQAGAFDCVATCFFLARRKSNHPLSNPPEKLRKYRLG